MNKKHRIPFVALFAALLGIFSQIALPLPSGIPLTLQTFAVALCGACLGKTLGPVAVLVWTGLGSVGVPVFSGFRGGLSVFTEPMGGFLVGFFALAWFCGMGSGETVKQAFFWGLLGLLPCHAMGVAWFCFVSHQPLATGFLTASLPFFLKDTLSVVGAALAARTVRTRIPHFLQ